MRRRDPGELPDPGIFHPGEKLVPTRRRRWLVAAGAGLILICGLLATPVTQAEGRSGESPATTNMRAAGSAAVASRRTSAVRAFSSPPPATAFGFGYDDLGRLVEASDPAGTSAFYSWDKVGNLNTISNGSSSAVKVAAISPTAGHVGQTVRIYGTGFSATASQDTVSFNGANASVSSATNSELVVSVPTGTSSGAVSVNAPGGSGTSPSPFTLTSAPSISSLSPDIVSSGGSFTVSGSNFASSAVDDSLAVNETYATVSAASGTSLTATVPGAAGSGPVTLETPQGVAKADLFVPPAGDSASSVVQTTRIALGSPQQVSVSGGQIAILIFDATAGERVFVNMTGISTSCPSGIQAALDDPHNTKLASTATCGSSSYLGTTTLPITGTYAIVISGQAVGTSSLTVTASNVPADASYAVSPSQAGAGVTVSTATPGQGADVTFTGTAGERIFVGQTSWSYPSSGVQVTLYNPDGSKAWGSNTWGGSGSSDYMDTVSLPQSGTYTFSVDPYGAGTGSIGLSFYQVPADSSYSVSPSQSGAGVTVSTGTPGQNGSVTFTGTAGERIFVDQASWSYPLGLGVFMSLYNPDGSKAWGPNSWGGIGAADYMDTVTLSQSGTYTFVVDPSGSQTGSVGLNFYAVPSDASYSVTPTTAGTQVTATTTVPGQNAAVTFQANAGNRVFVNYSNSTTAWTYPSSATVNVTLKNPDGSTFSGPYRWNNGSSYYTSYVDLDEKTLSQSGTYTLYLDPTSSATGSVTFTIYQVPADYSGQISIGGSPATVTTTTPGQNASVTFQGTSGTNISLTPSNYRYQSWSAVAASIKNPDGSTLVSAHQWTTTNSTALTATLHQTGTYTIFLDPNYDSSGSITLNLADPPGGARPPTSSAPSRSRTPRAHDQSAMAKHRNQSLSTSVAHPRQRPSRPPRHSRATPGEPRAHHRVTPSSRRPQPNGLPPHGYLPRYPASWTPGTPNLTGDWTTHRSASPWSNLGGLYARDGVTALSGQTLKLNGLPLAGVTVSLEGTTARARTDSTGRFLLQGVPAGHGVLDVDGATATDHGRHFASFQIGVDVHQGLETTVQFPIWLPELDAAHTVAVSSPTRKAITLRTPHIPGLEVKIPAGSTITAADGKPVKHLSVIAVPVDRPPFPLPMGSYFPVYLSIQPAGAYVSQGAQIIYPNYSHIPAGQRVPFWNYDPEHRGWYIYGEGRVTSDGRHIVPDPGVRIWRFSGAMISGSLIPPFLRDIFKAITGGDPVNLGSGLWTYQKTDLELPDTLPVALTRSYRPGDSNSYSFGIGTTNSYDIRLFSQSNYFSAELILPDGMDIHYTCIQSCGTTFTGNEEYQAESSPTEFYDSTITHVSSPTAGWLVRLRNGMSYFFPEFGPLAWIRDRFGNQVTVSRNSNGNMTQVISPHGRWISFQYDSNNRIIKATDNAGRTVNYYYNGESATGNCGLTADTGPTGTLACVQDADGHDTIYSYDSSTGWMTKITDARGYAFVTNTYDSTGRVLTQTIGNDPNPYTFSYVTGSNGQLTQSTMTSPNGDQTITNLDSNGFPSSVTYGANTPVADTITYQRQAGTDLLASQTDQLTGVTTSYGYDALGNLSTVTDDATGSSPRTTTITYDPTYSQPVSVKNAAGKTTTYGYDDLGELTSITDPMGNQTTVAYANRDGRPTSITTPASGLATTSYGYTLADPTSVTDPNGNTSYTYFDAAGRLRTSTDPDGDTTAYGYDNLNDLTSVTDANGQATNIAYNNDGEVTSITDANQNTTQFGYDHADRLSSRQDALGNQWNYGYDGDGNLNSVQDPKGQTATYTYDPLERLQFAGYTAPNSGSYQSTINYAYATSGENRTVQAVDSTGGTFNDTYDPFGELINESGPNGAIDYTYNPDGTRASATVSGQSQVSYGYNDDALLTSVSGAGGNVGLGYDGDSRLQKLTLPDGISQNYTYDPASRPTDVIYDNSSGSQIGDLHYQLDPDGNRTAEWGSYARLTIPQATATAVYNADNQISSIGATGYTYDANGNLTGDGNNTYAWNARNQLIAISGQNTATFTYDPSGRREQATINGTSTSYLDDGQNVVQELSGGNPTVNYLLGPTLDQRYARTDTNGTQSYLTDPLGSTLALANSDQTLPTTYTYDPFGAATSTGATSTNPYQFAGQQNDGTGLNYDNARYYSPSMGSFTSPDPLGNTTSGPNLYQYANQNPINETDPTGLISLSLSGVKDILGTLAVVTLSTFDPELGFLELADGAVTDAATATDAALGNATEAGGEDLYAFGNTSGPSGARLGDFGVSGPGDTVGPYSPTSPLDEIPGASTTTDPAGSGLSGHYYRLPAGTDLPEGLGLHADGSDVGGLGPAGHRTIYPTASMSYGQFQDLFKGLPWEWAGKL